MKHPSENHWQDKWWFCPSALSIWKDSREGVPAYPHTFFGKDFPSDCVMRKLTNCTATFFQGGVWELVRASTRIAATSQRDRYRNTESLLTNVSGNLTRPWRSSVRSRDPFPPTEQRRETLVCDRSEVKTTNQNPKPSSLQLVLTAVLWRAQWGGGWVSVVYQRALSAGRWGRRPGDCPWGAHRSVGKADGPTDSCSLIR